MPVGVVGCPGMTGAVVTGVTGAVVTGVTGAVVAGVTRVGVGSWVGSCVGVFSDGPTVSGEVVDSPSDAGVGVTTGRGSDRRWGAAGSGTSGVFTVGPPSRLLTSSTTYPPAGMARNAPARRMVRWRRPVESTKTGSCP
jgi:hypothetical protein